MMTSSVKYPLAPKVKWAALGSYVLGVAITTLYAILNNGDIVEGIPDWLVAMVAPLLPAGAAAGAGYQADHQVRAGERPAPTVEDHPYA